MFVILTYDVAAPRVSKVLKLARRYLRHVQRSVLEGRLSAAQLKTLEEAVLAVIDPAEDTVRFYVVTSERCLSTHEFGAPKRPTGTII